MGIRSFSSRAVSRFAGGGAYKRQRKGQGGHRQSGLVLDHGIDCWRPGNGVGRREGEKNEEGGCHEAADHWGSERGVGRSTEAPSAFSVRVQHDARCAHR